MSLPPVPPRPNPYEQQAAHPSRQSSLPPPVPPLPPNYRPEQDDEYYGSRPHWEDPLVAPRPHKITPDLPANMARTLDEQAATSYAPPPPSSYAPAPYSSPPPPGMPQINLNPGFVVPQQQRGPSPAPPPQGAWNGWNMSSPPPPQSYGASPPLGFPGGPGGFASPPPPQQQANDSLSASMAALSFGAPTGQQQPPHHRQPSTFSTYGPPAKSPSPPRQLSGGAPSLTAPLPAIPTLSAALDTIQNPAHDPTQRIAWCRDVLLLVDRLQPASAAGGASAAAGTDPVTGPARITDPTLQRLALAAVPIVLQLASSAAAGQQMPPHVAEAVYLRATLANTGQFPDLVPRSPRTAFRDFELAARNGHHAAWFRLGREYESVNDAQHARDCFERGVKLNVESCLYRMGMAHLMGQLGLPANSTVAVPLLQRAATLATVACPQPAYVLGLLLLDEFSHVSIPPQTFASVLPPGSSREAEARRHLERAAYLNFAPAQYKLGHAYEFAQAPFPFDPLLSVQYYSLASQQGEIEADMALSKWFLCGAEGCFEKDEALAYTFAEKAARKGLPSAEFAMGYYAEVGVGGPKDMQAARKWYTRAADHGNADAKERLAALAQDQSLSRQEHDVLTENTLVRKRTQAKQRSDARPGAAPARTQQAAEGQRIVNVIRQNSLAQPPAPGPAPFPAPAAGPSSAHTSPSLAPAQVPPLGYQQRRPSHADTASPPAPLGATQGPEPRRPSHADTSPDPASFARPNPPRAHPNAHRYTLADPGFGSAPPPGAPGPGRAQSPGQGPPREQSPAFRPPGQRPGREQSATPGGQPQQRPNAGSPAPDRPKPAGPTTFAEMGIQSGKLEDKECIIM